MAYLHRDCGLVHRDLKPSNVLVDSARTFKVCDFCIGDGTLDYMPPEACTPVEDMLTDSAAAATAAAAAAHALTVGSLGGGGGSACGAGSASSSVWSEPGAPSFAGDVWAMALVMWEVFSEGVLWEGIGKDHADRRRRVAAGKRPSTRAVARKILLDAAALTGTLSRHASHITCSASTTTSTTSSDDKVDAAHVAVVANDGAGGGGGGSGGGLASAQQQQQQQHHHDHHRHQRQEQHHHQQQGNDMMIAARLLLSPDGLGTPPISIANVVRQCEVGKGVHAVLDAVGGLTFRACVTSPCK
jgi:serine/threonine protein kinase